MVSARQVAIDFGFDDIETKIVENGPISWAFFNNLLKDKGKCPVLWQCIDEMNYIKKVFNNLILQKFLMLPKVFKSRDSFRKLFLSFRTLTTDDAKHLPKEIFNGR